MTEQILRTVAKFLAGVFVAFSILKFLLALTAPRQELVRGQSNKDDQHDAIDYIPDPYGQIANPIDGSKQDYARDNKQAPYRKQFMPLGIRHFHRILLRLFRRGQPHAKRTDHGTTCIWLKLLLDV